MKLTRFKSSNTFNGYLSFNPKIMIVLDPYEMFIPRLIGKYSHWGYVKPFTELNYLEIEMSDKKLLIRINPNNKSEELKAMLDEFQAHYFDKDNTRPIKWEGIITIPEKQTIITEEGDLLFFYADRVDFLVVLSKDEYQVITES